jgi:hypothetical protein
LLKPSPFKIIATVAVPTLTRSCLILAILRVERFSQPDLPADPGHNPQVIQSLRHIGLLPNPFRHRDLLFDGPTCVSCLSLRLISKGVKRSCGKWGNSSQDC